MAQGTGVSIGKQAALTVSNVAVGLTVPSGSPNRAVVTVESNSIRFWVDGSTPTSANGHLAEAGDVITLEGAEEVNDFRAIRVSADATVQATFGRY